LDAVRSLLAEWRVPSVHETVVVALSGGPDSVALADALITLRAESGWEVVLAHLDHQLRPDSAADARFCEELAFRWGVPIRVSQADVRARASRERGGLEDAARRERYSFLEEVRRSVNASYVAVGHTRNDQAETLLLRLLRGAGSDGLASMRARSGILLRPLLHVSREEVLAHLGERGLPWRDDPTNRDVSLMRNRVRHELLPYLEARFNPAVLRSLARTADILAEDADVLEGQAEAVVRASVQRDGGHWVLPVSVLETACIGEARRVLRRVLDRAGGLHGVSAHHVDALLTLALAPGGSGRRLALPGNREALRSFDRLRVGPAPRPAVAYAFALPIPGRVELPGGLAVTAAPVDAPVEVGSWSAVIPAPPETLTVRTRRAGDRVDDGGRKESLKRFLMRHRVPTTERAALPLVAAGARVVFIPGLPIAAQGGGPRVRLSVERPA
jgi:tRNA(Ile)-lysidine synthase